MISIKDTFVNAARHGRAAHISVHLDMDMMNMVGLMDGFQRAWNNSQTLLNGLEGKVPSLITTMGADSILVKGEQDVLAKSASYSAIDNPTHTQFIETNDVNVALISGVAATKCVKETMIECKERGITPILVMDATDLAEPYDSVTPENYDYFRETAEMSWGEDVLTTSLAEIDEWLQELDAA